MQKRFVSNYHYQKMFLKIQTLRQGYIGVENHVKELQTVQMLCEVNEPLEQTMA